MGENIHGGDVYRNSIQRDFSVNINPQGVPPQVQKAILDAALYSNRYPDYRSGQLIRAIAEMEEVSENAVLCGNGASELFPAVVHAIAPQKTVIPIPSFYGYERAVQAGSGEILFFQLEEFEGFAVTEAILDVLTADCNLLFLANPNNPTGKRIPKDLLNQILDHCREWGIIVVLDECFLDFTENSKERSMLRKVSEYPNLIVVRAFTKLFAIPGVRLGYLVCENRVLLEQIALQLPEWNVSIFAQAAGIAAAQESEYRKGTPDYVQREREYLIKGLEQHASWLRIFPGDADFLLLRTEIPLYEKLLEQGILIRDCSNFRGMSKGYYRIAVKMREENEILLKAIQDIM